MSTVAQCADNPAPADGTVFSGCSSVVWVSHTDVSDLSQQNISDIFIAVVGLLATVFVWRLLRKVM